MSELSDDQVVSILNSAVAAINPVLDALATDPLGLKAHTYHSWPSDGTRAHKAIHLLSTPLEVADVPGTDGWEKLSMQERASWWITRIGRINTIAVAFPNIFGFWARYLPVSSTLGFANQAMVLVAIAREYQVRDRNRQVELLASVLCRRDVTASANDAPAAIPDASRPHRRSLVRSVWSIAHVLRGLSGEMDRRPSPRKPIAVLSGLPLIGAPFSYLGEAAALQRAANEGRRWIVAHPDAVGNA